MTPHRTQVLIGDDDPAIRDSLQMILMAKFQVFMAECIDDAKCILDQQPIDVILLDIEFPNNQSGLSAIGDFHDLDPYVQIVMVSGYKYQHYIFEAGRKGAFDFIAKPFEIAHIISTINKAYEYRLHKQTQEQVSRKYNVVLFDRNPDFYISAKLILKDEFHLFCCSNLDLTKGILKKEKVDVLIFDYKEVAHEIDGFVAEVLGHNPELRMIATTANPREVWTIEQKGQVPFILPKTASALEIINMVSAAASRRAIKETPASQTAKI